MSFMRVDEMPSSVLVIDRDPLTLAATGSVLNMQGHRCVLARSAEMAMQSIATGQFDVIVLAIDALHSGCEFASQLRSTESSRDVPVIFLVPELSNEWLPKLAAQGGVYCMLQPIDPYALVDLVEKALWMPHVAKGRTGAPQSHLTREADWVKLTNEPA